LCRKNHPQPDEEITMIEIENGGNENSEIVILMRIPLLSYRKTTWLTYQW
jgi:hypothetical protein